MEDEVAADTAAAGAVIANDDDDDDDEDEDDDTLRELPPRRDVEDTDTTGRTVFRGIECTTTIP